MLRVRKLDSLRLLQWLAVGCAAIASCTGQSASDDLCAIGVYPPLFSRPTNITGLLIDGAHPSTCTGCLTHWELCYHITTKEYNTTSNISLTLALWREKEDGVMSLVSESRVDVEVAVSESNERFVCQEWSMEGCEVEVREGDRAGAIVLEKDAPIFVVGKMEGEMVMVSPDRRSVAAGGVNVSSMERHEGQGLLVFSRVDMEPCPNRTKDKKSCSSRPRRLNRSPVQYTCIITTTLTPSPSSESLGNNTLWVWVVIAFLCLLVLALLVVIPVFIITRWSCNYRWKKKNPLQAILLNGPKKPSLRHTNGADSILPAEVPDSTSCRSTHSADVSPALQLESGGARAQSNGHPTTTAARLSWQPGTRETPRTNTPSQAEGSKILSLPHRPPPPPIKPKPPYRSALLSSSSSSSPPPPLRVSRMDSEKTHSSQSPPLPSTNAPSPLSSGGLSSPPSQPPCGTRENYSRPPAAPPFLPPQINGPLRRSVSDDLLSLLSPDDAFFSSQHARERLRLRFPSASRPRRPTIPTGSLPELRTPAAALASPAVDEDNYTIPSHLPPLPSSSSSPQPYLTPQSLYSYAYSHTTRTLAAKYRSGAQGKPVPTIPATSTSKRGREKTPSTSSNPYESIKYCGRPGEAVLEEPDYDEISDVEESFVTETGRDATPTFGKLTPASSPCATPICSPVGAKGADKSAGSTHNHTPFISRSHSSSLPDYTHSGPSQRIKLRHMLSSPLPQAPVSRPRVSSTTSDGYGYVNEDEFPRPTTLPPSLPNPSHPQPPPSQPPTPLRYTKLHHSLIEEDSTYDILLEQYTNFMDSTWARPVYKYRQDYDHLEEGEEEGEGEGEKGGYDRLSSSRSSYS